MSTKKILSVDLGASSGRVMLGIFDGESIELSEIHRFENVLIQINNHLYWNILGIYQEILKGISIAGRKYGEIDSISVDTWGVDYCYLDQDGDLILNPYSYRDQRTKKHEEELHSLLSEEEIFKKTGVQPALINTLNQIHSDLVDKPYLNDIIHKVLFIPDFFHYLLSGKQSNEFTIASTSNLLDARTGDFSEKILEKTGIKRSWFSTVTKKGKILGGIRSHLKEELNLENLKVIAGASHDTASAIMAIPYTKNEQETVFISSGTWSLVGFKTEKPILSKKAFSAGLTNEGTFDGKYRILKNITGMWIYNELRREWEDEGIDISHDRLISLAEHVNDNHTYIDPNAKIFSTPGDMKNKIVEFCEGTGQEVPEIEGEFVRIILESLALSYRYTIEQLEDVGEKKIKQIQIVGGGINNTFLCQLTADYTNKNIVAGPIEASSLGNILSQLDTLGMLHEKTTEIIKNSSRLVTYESKETLNLKDKYEKFLTIVEIKEYKR